MRRSVAIILVAVMMTTLSACAGPQSPTDVAGKPRLVRIPQRGMLGGVAAGLGYYFGVSPTIVRVGIVATVVFAGTGTIIYLICWAVIPPATSVPVDYDARTGG